jgi:hydroxyethylthiazole kinase-like uncharacterized protein yjeF
VAGEGILAPHGVIHRNETSAVSHEIISVAQMRAIDAAASAAGVPTLTLMENAGRAVAEAIMARYALQPVALLCGPGNNAGDGWVAARLLHEAGWPVEVHSLVPREALHGDAALAAARWLGEVHLLSGETPDAALYVDALFGAGLARPLDGVAKRLALSLPRTRVIAIDTPSGLEGDTGRALGDIAFQAALTITFVRKKPAHVFASGRALCGEVVVADIGVPDRVVSAQNISLFENSPALWRFPWPRVDAHKHARGHVIAASGAHGRTGAARLSARAALRIGAGLSTVLSPSDAMAENAAQLTAIMLREAKTADDYARSAGEAQCLVIGPAFGLGALYKTYLDAALAAPQRCPCVLDADALTLLAPLERKLDPRDVLTPHLGEFKRLFPDLPIVDRIAAVRTAAARASAIVLLKGPDTLIAHPDGRVVINSTGSPHLATAGSGDVLAGLIAGLIGQGMGAFAAAAAGAWLHGKCGEALGPGLIAEDLPEILPSILKALAKDSGAGDRVG